MTQQQPARAHRAFAVCLAFLLVGVSPDATSQAQTRPDVANAREFGREGLRALDDGDMARADAALSAAIDLHDAPTLRLARARARTALGRLLAAREDYAITAKWPAASGDSAAFKQARRTASEEAVALEAQIPRLTVEFQGPGKIQVSGVEWPRSFLGTARPLDPGDYLIQAITDRGIAARVRVQLLAGERETARLDHRPTGVGFHAGTQQAATPVAATPIALSKLGETARAEDNTTHAVESAPTRPERPAPEAVDCAPAFCNNLGLLHANGAGVPKDHKYAAALYEKACDGGVAAGCNNLGRQYSLGRGVRKDTAHAAELYTRACDRALHQGCVNLALLHLRGDGVARDLERAATLLEDSCTATGMLGCVALAAMYQQGQGLPRDPQRAASLLATACEGGDALGCNNLGALYEAGRAVPGDSVRARELYRTACDKGVDLACAHLERLGDSR